MKVFCKECGRECYDVWELRVRKFDTDYSPEGHTHEVLLDGGTFCGQKCFITYLQGTGSKVGLSEYQRLNNR